MFCFAIRLDVGGTLQLDGMISANDVLGVVVRMGSEGAFWFQQLAGDPPT